MSAYAVATTGADGRFWIPVGRSQHVGARKPGYVDSYFVNLAAAEGDTAAVRLALRGTSGVIRGVVRGVRGRPIAGALVTAGVGGYERVLGDGRQVTMQPPPLASTAEDGTFCLDGLEGGVVSLDLRPRAGRWFEVVVRAAPRAGRDEVEWVDVDVFDAGGLLVDRLGSACNEGDGWRLKLVLPPGGGGEVVVRAFERKPVRRAVAGERVEVVVA